MFILKFIIQIIFYQATKLTPNRKRETCKGWALSFYDKRENAIKEHKVLTKDRPKLKLKLGTHLAKGNLNKEDGISDMPNDSGHFDHFEYLEAKFDGFIIIEELD